TSGGVSRPGVALAGAVCARLAGGTVGPFDASVVVLRGRDDGASALLNVWQYCFGRGSAAFAGRRIKDQVAVVRDQAFGRIEAISSIGQCNTSCSLLAGVSKAKVFRGR